jgi:hypothetical protein
MNSDAHTRGRGAGFNPANRFESLSVEPESDWDPAEDRPVRTQFLRDLSQSIISYNDSPDIPGLNEEEIQALLHVAAGAGPVLPAMLSFTGRSPSVLFSGSGSNAPCPSGRRKC